MASQWVRHIIFRAMMALYAGTLWIAIRLGPKREIPSSEGWDVLLTATFYSQNWIASHLRPLALSPHIRRIRMVSVFPVPDIDKVEAVYPPHWLIRSMGEVPARLLMFFMEGLRSRPDAVGGFHLLVNGLASLLLGNMTGASTIYFCGGGPREVLGGGIYSDNRLFTKLKTASPVVERRLLDAVGEFDYVITMGEAAKTYFRGKNVGSAIHVISGGMDTNQFMPGTDPPIYDVIFVGRLGKVKQVDLLLQAFRFVIENIPKARLLIVGDGPLKEELQSLANSLGIGSNVAFVGHQNNISEWLKKSKIFALTSKSEGLSLAMMEAMMCGLPVVVPDVGDLRELVNNGVNGYLVSDHEPFIFAQCIMDILTNDELRENFSLAARSSSEKYDIRNVSMQWADVLSVKSS